MLKIALIFASVLILAVVIYAIMGALVILLKVVFLAVVCFSLAAMLVWGICNILRKPGK